MKFTQQASTFSSITHDSGGLTTEIQSRLHPYDDLDVAFGKHGHYCSQISIVSPQWEVEGKTQAEWGDAWWTTSLETSKDRNPLSSDRPFSPIGAVQFLAGSNSSDPATRSITVTDQNYLFMPVVTQTVDEVGYPADWTEKDSRIITNAVINTVNPETLVFEVNGHSLINGKAWEQYRQQSPQEFSYTVPKDFYLGPDAGYPEGLKVNHDISDGYWVMLNPLPVGNYTIHFGGVIDYGRVKPIDLNGDGRIGYEATNSNPTSIEVVESLLQYLSTQPALNVDVTYNVQVTQHSSINSNQLDLSALSS